MRYFIGFLVTIGFIIMVFVLIFTMTGRNPSSTGNTTQNPLTSYAKTSKIVRLTIDGVLTADSTHRQIVINVGQSQATLQVMSGYQGNVIETKSYDNNQSAYQIFLLALQRAGFSSSNGKTNQGDARGACPLGRRYFMEVWDGNDRLQSNWTTSCQGGTFAGNISTVMSLFQAQIPDYNSIVNKYTF